MINFIRENDLNTKNNSRILVNLDWVYSFDSEIVASS